MAASVATPQGEESRYCAGGKFGIVCSFGGHSMTLLLRRCLAGLVVAIVGATAASAADTIRVGKASAGTFAFAPIEIGKEKGIWAKYDLDVVSIGFGGDARLQQAMVAN